MYLFDNIKEYLADGPRFVLGQIKECIWSESQMAREYQETWGCIGRYVQLDIIPIIYNNVTCISWLMVKLIGQIFWTG
jgi:hypothetical protein